MRARKVMNTPGGTVSAAASPLSAQRRRVATWLATWLATSGLLAGCVAPDVRDSLLIQNPSVRADGFDADQSDEAGAATESWVRTYGAIAVDARLDDVARRLNQLGSRRQSYVGYKAGCWVDAGRETRAGHDAWGFAEETAYEADHLTTGLENMVSLPPANPVLRTSALLRPDLWSRLETARASATLASCPEAQRLVACSEVELIHAGHEAWTRDFDGAAVRVSQVESRMAGLTQMLAACAPATKPARPPRTIALPADLFFDFDRGDLDGIHHMGRVRLDELVRQLHEDTDVSAIRADGFTDRIGSDRYNLELSRQRAETIVDYLQTHVGNVEVSAIGHGKARPLIQCDERNRDALIECLAPNRRVELTFARRKRTTPGTAASNDAQDSTP